MEPDAPAPLVMTEQRIAAPRHRLETAFAWWCAGASAILGLWFFQHPAINNWWWERVYIVIALGAALSPVPREGRTRIRAEFLLLVAANAMGFWFKTRETTGDASVGPIEGIPVACFVWASVRMLRAAATRDGARPADVLPWCCVLAGFCTGFATVMDVLARMPFVEATLGGLRHGGLWLAALPTAGLAVLSLRLRERSPHDGGQETETSPIGPFFAGFLLVHSVFLAIGFADGLDQQFSLHQHAGRVYAAVWGGVAIGLLAGWLHPRAQRDPDRAARNGLLAAALALLLLLIGLGAVPGHDVTRWLHGHGITVKMEFWRDVPLTLLTLAPVPVCVGYALAQLPRFPRSGVAWLGGVAGFFILTYAGDGAFRDDDWRTVLAILIATALVFHFASARHPGPKAAALRTASDA